MRVNLTYSVDLDQVPSAASGIVFQAAEDVRRIAFQLEKVTKNLKNDPDISKILNEIDTVREDMVKDITKIDSLLRDSSIILAGYQKTITELYLPKEEESEEENDGTDDGNIRTVSNDEG